MISGTLRPESAIMFRRSIRQRLSRLARSRARSRPLRGDLGRADLLDPGRVHDDVGVPILRAGAEPRLQLHPQFREGRDRRYDGTVTFYSTDETEPILAAYSRMFPGMFQPLAQMPEDLRRHIRYRKASSSSRPRCTAPTT